MAMRSNWLKKLVGIIATTRSSVPRSSLISAGIVPYKKNTAIMSSTGNDSPPDSSTAVSASVFDNAEIVARYAQGPIRMVPGYLDLQRMVTLLLAERVPSENGRVLVVGAGGGLELLAFATRHPTWQFVGVDPSEKMLALAEQRLGPEFMARVTLHQGYTEDLPDVPRDNLFDEATCLLTLHHVSLPDRLRTLQEIQKRLRPGAPLVVAHMSFPQQQHDGQQRAQWLKRYMDFADITDPDKVTHTLAAVDEKLCIISPVEDEEVLRNAGFHRVELFYAGFAFRGWVAYKNNAEAEAEAEAE